jgi:outer membrane lipoprotein
LTMTIFILVISACTSIPEQIQGSYPEISPARVEPGVYGSSVRWGGIIIDSRNTENLTCFEVLSRDLDKYLRPKVEDRTNGRYIACKPGFHDPQVFSNGREITVTGNIRTIETRQVDEFDYRYPVLDVDELVLWEKRENVVVYNNFHDPFFYGPYGSRYRGFYPYYGYGYGYGYGYPYPMHSRGTARVRQTLPDAAELEPDQ